LYVFVVGDGEFGVGVGGGGVYVLFFWVMVWE